MFEVKLIVHMKTVRHGIQITGPHPPNFYDVTAELLTGRSDRDRD
jgi:hypothetical protein